MPKKYIGDLSNITDGPHGYHVVDETSPVVMLTAKNAKDWFTDKDSADPIALYVHEANKRSSLKENDIILSTRGTVGSCALVTKEVLPANIDQDVARISLLPDGSILPGYIVAYLNSDFGQDHISRYSTGMVQQGLSLQKVREIPIPILSNIFQQSIDEVVSLALSKKRDAIRFQSQAEQTLLKALGLEGWQPPEPLTYSRRASEALAARRIDSDFFAPRVSQLLEILSRDGQVIEDVAPVRREGFDPTKEKTDSFDYIEIGGLRSDGTCTAECVPLDEAPSRANQRVRSGDIITSTVRPIRRLSAFIQPDQDGFVCSSGFVVLEPTKIAPEVLLTYLRLPIFCELMDLHTSASLYPAISEKDLLKLPIPKIAKEHEAAIIKAVQSAHAARQEAQDLLERAKRAVEIAIEEGEPAALKFLKN